MKKYLLASAVVCLFSVPAQSADFTSSFYIPTKTVMSDTLYSFGRSVNKNAGKVKSYTDTAKEELTYGFNDSVAVRTSFTRKWTKTAGISNHDNSNTYGIGGIWKPINGDFKLLTSLDFSNVSDTKSYAGMLQLGYSVTPDVTLLARAFYTETRDDVKNKNEPAAQLGVYAKHGKASGFVGVKYTQTNEQLSKETRTTGLAVNFDYKLNDKTALGLRTTYLLDKEVRQKGLPVKDEFENYSIGVNLKYVF